MRIRRCILSYQDSDQFSSISSIVNRCAADHLRISDDKLMKLVSDYGENKYFLNIKTIGPRENCIYLTMGIGYSSKAERNFHKLYPHCKIFGIEAATEAYGDFAQIGKILSFAIGKTHNTLVFASETKNL